MPVAWDEFTLVDDKPKEFDWSEFSPVDDKAGAALAVPSQEEQAQIRRLPRPEELATYGGPPKPVASLSETMVEPVEEALGPKITTPKLPIKEGENKLLTVGKEVVNILSGIPEFLSSPLGVVSTVVAPGAPVAVGTVFTTTMLKDLADQVQQSYKDWDKMSGTQKTKAITDMVGTGTFAGLPWLKPAINALRGKPTTPEVTDASKVQETTAVHGDVREQPVESAREVPVEEGRGGVQPPETTQGEVPLKPQLSPPGQEPAAGEYRVREMQTVSQTDAAMAKAQAEINEAWPEMTTPEREAATRGKGLPKRFGGRAEDIPEPEKAPEPPPQPPPQVPAPVIPPLVAPHPAATKEEKPSAAPESAPVQEPKSGAAGTEPVSETEPSKAPVEVPQEAGAEPVPEPTKPAEPPDSRTVLGTAQDIKISAPEGATQIRVTTPDGKHSVQSIADLKKGNTFKGVDIAKVEAGTIGRDGKFKAMEGEVSVEDKSKLSGPGTPAAAQPPDPKAAIEALEESFRNIRGPRPTLADQVRKAFSVGEKAARAKDAVSSAVQGLKSSGDYLINKWKGEPKLDNMLRAKGELSAELETRGWRVRKFVKTVEKAMPTQRQRAAVLKWVDAGGDPAELQRGLDQTRPEFKQAYQDALNLKGDDLIAAQNIRSYFEERLQDAMDAGVLQQGVEDYIHRLYERDPKTQKQALAYVQSGLLQQNPALVKKRVFQFDWEAERAGRRPIQDFLPRIANYESSLSRAIAAREFVRKMVGYEEGNKRIPGMKAPDGRPVIDVAGLGVPVEDAAGVRDATLIKPSFKPGDEADPKNNRRDYVERDYPALRKWRWTTLDAGGKPIFVQGNLLIHPDFVGRVDALLETSRVKYGRYPKLGRAALGASSTVKQTMLDLSGFHQVQITVHGMEHKVMPWRIVKDIDFQNPNMDGLLKGGLTLGGEYYSAHHGEGLVGSALTRHIPILGPLMETYHNWLFQSYIPRIKTTMALAALERNRARYKGQLTEEQIYTKTANEANSAFGELNYIMLERSKTTQDIARLVMLAPDFLEARGRFAGGALEKGGKLGGHEQRAALLLGALTMYITARIANKLTDDKYHFEPENAFSLVHNGHAYSLRTVQGDILHLLEQPLQFWMNRLNPVFGRTLLQLATGRDYFGRKRTVPETLWDTVKNTVPIALRSSQERKLWESMMNSMGVTARRWNDVDKAFTLAKDWKKQHGITEPGEFIYDPEKDPLRGLKIALSHSDDAGAAQEIRKVLASKVYTREKLNAYFDRYAKMPFTGSAANDRKWMATLTDDQRKIVEGARQHKIALRNMYRQSRAKFDDLAKTPLP